MRELFTVERMHLKPLPAWIPEVYRLHPRTVDVEGYVSVHSMRYSVPVGGLAEHLLRRHVFRRSHHHASLGPRRDWT